MTLSSHIGTYLEDNMTRYTFLEKCNSVKGKTVAGMSHAVPFITYIISYIIIYIYKSLNTVEYV